MTVPARLLLLAVALALVYVPLASADGDPASDILLSQDVYLPSTPPSGPVGDQLWKAVADAYARGYRLKVAVIATVTDLGAIPSLYGMPGQYASFLGQEIRLYYGGPLLIVMPAGFGIYDQGLPTPAEKRVLARVTVKAQSADELTETATAAVDALVAAHALTSKDTTPPSVAVLPATAPRGRTVTLRFYVADDSKHATATFQILATGRPLVTRHFRYTLAIPTRARATSWLVPPSIQPGPLQVCVTASDPSGNRSKTVCADLQVT